MTFSVTRRGFALGGLAALASGTLAACGSTSTDPASAPSTAAGPWTYTDGAGRKISTPAQPKRIAAFADYALVLMAYGITPVAIFGRYPVAKDERFADFDISDIPVVGNAYGEIDLEALAATTPDLIVTGIYPVDSAGTIDANESLYALADKEQQTQLEKIAPIVAVKIGGKGLQVADAFVKLAQSLGGDQAKIDAEKKLFDAAAAKLTAATKAAPDIEVTQMYADTSGVYVVKPADEPMTELYASYGVKYTTLAPDSKYYWAIYSWENASKMFGGDVLLCNYEGYGAAELAKQATFAGNPALKAGQVHTWETAAFGYSFLADQMTELASIIEKAKNVA